jgi:predicted dehydrogenase
MIGTDPFSHYKIAKFCLENEKHVLMEKPLTLSLKESLELKNIAEKKKLKFCIVHNFQFSNSSTKLDKEISKGKLGEIKGLYAFQFGNPKRRLPSWYERLPFGLFFDESPHLLYLLDKYAKGITLVNSTKFNSTTGLNTPALVNANFKTKLGIPAFLYTNFESPLSEWYLLVIGDKRLGILDIFRDIYFSLPNDNGHKALDILRTSRKGIFGHLKGTFFSGLKVLNKNYLCGNERIVDIFAESILNNKSSSPIGIDDAIRINKLQFEIIENSKEI